MKQASGKKTALTLTAVQEASSEPVYRRGVQYYRRKKVLKYTEDEGVSNIEALVIGSEPQPYKVVVTIDSPEVFKAECSCPYFEEVCKHSVAVLLTHIARHNPGIRFDLNEGTERRDVAVERAPKAKELLDDPRDEGVLPDAREFELGLLVLEKPLAMIVGQVPTEPQGKVNILKVPPETLNFFPEETRIWRLAKYLTSLPQTTKGTAGGHRIPRGEEGIVIGHLSLCARLLNTGTENNAEITFSEKSLKPRAVLSETENGELLLKIEGVTEEGVPVEHPVFFMGTSSWILSENVFYPIDLSGFRNTQYYDSFGCMNIKLEHVPKFLSVDLPLLLKRMPVIFDETSAPFPVAITEPPQVVIKLSERRQLGSSSSTVISSSSAANSKERSVSESTSLEVTLGFRYGDLVMQSRDETSAVESEKFTRTISESGQSVWVERQWELENQVRRILTNMQPTRTIADRFSFVDEPACEVLYQLQAEQVQDWEIGGFDQLKTLKVRKEQLSLKAALSLKKESYKFDFDLVCLSDNEEVPFPSVIEVLFRNRNFLKLPSGDFVRIPTTTLLSLLKSIGQSKDSARPLYQALGILHALETHEITVDSDKGFKEFIHKIHNFRELPPLELPPEFKGELREYQKEGCNWLMFLREYGLAGILADDMGLGKTIQALSLLLKHYKSGKDRAPSLVVAPTSVVYNWLSEASKFTPTLKTALFLGRDRGELLAKLSKEGGAKPQVIFTTYGIIRRDYEQLKNIQFEFLILDEAQNIKNPESVGAVAAKSLKAFHRLALSGTPVENRLKELWSLFDFLMPEFLGAYKDFNEVFERPIEAGLEGAGQKLRKIVNPFILRRLKSQVEKELPARTDIIQLCELDDEQRSLYLDVLDECRAKVFNEIASKGIKRSNFSVLAALLRLRQVCCDPRLLKNPGDKVTEKSAKLDAFINMIGEIVEEGHKILVFSQFVGMLTLIRQQLEKIGYTYEYLDGQTPAKERLERVDKFNESPEIPIFLISLKAGGTGLNLTGADYVIHYDPWWNPAVENQATDRAHRIGQKRHVFNYKLITRGTVEEKILALQEKKKELAELVIGGDDNVAKELTQEDLEFLFSF
ncbi:MAG: SNF2 helicase associated domain-containing protein [Candidatus Obscuribacter sp.]|jgi:SNF2 family DNA or RNA helicase|nr:SNF2 helicase associated domain-containing protein [Candidatus Obscuribacter sp.]MBP6351115.1 SNF2 helicase associated domain-containing protein [Candidatus Obscuribacter sp.]MBP7576407.1 SNF2 helicase associated domain-containing protein [Candidatus Obscuribacter sp.]